MKCVKTVVFIFIFLSFFMLINIYSVTIIGHRGACGYAPENTIASFKKALECGVDMIELDVWRCASGELVVFHDAKVDYVTNGNGYIVDKTFDELQKLYVLNQARIPTLQSVLDIINRKAHVYIEIKDCNATDEVCALIEKYVRDKGWNYTDFLVASFDHYQLLKVKNKCPFVSIGALMHGIPIGYGSFATSIGADVAILSTDFINHQFVADIHEQEMNVFVYTANDDDEITKMIMLGVDGIVSNYPDRVRQVLNNARN